MSAREAIREHALATFKDWIIGQIKAKGLTRHQFLAAVFGADENGHVKGGGSGYYQVVNGKVLLTVDMMERWARALDTAMSDINNAYGPVEVIVRRDQKQARKRPASRKKPTDLLLASPAPRAHVPAVFTPPPAQQLTAPWTMEPDGAGVRLTVWTDLKEAMRIVELISKGITLS